MGKPGDVSPEVAAATTFSVLGSAVEYARKNMPEFVAELESRHLKAAKRLVEIDQATLAQG
ncbi:hypothetical protein J4T94_gp077 [Mycobacterium phage Krypton555]|uniref:Uncharacterized protein n=2 Tax=Lumosvirus TaxID=2948808 RepID=A0A222ZRX2_9CAUD|nr:hypothetical protein N852_gp076 [Mycobacterium phage Whirlwind]YP_010012690.1 hypothetical protein J4T94_gp077 [Mycobacterium phage Krypton555]AGT12709.1 hypothetical protein PBI_WHIRLWIND_103 [Mycobacterium phage Whirlwind]ASR87139.1 hypothetical protein KRYPTON555_105 [Mycobacterium phage Krypton555]